MLPDFPDKIVVASSLKPEDKQISGVFGDPQPFYSENILVGKFTSGISTHGELVSTPLAVKSRYGNRPVLHSEMNHAR